MGKWKLVAFDDEPWELYDFTTDRSEMNNLIEKHPDIAARIDKAWTLWAEENQVTPLPGDYGVKYLMIDP